MSKQGTEYELFVKEIYELLHHADGVDDVCIQHDVKLKGASGVEHQIDLFWTFTRGGVAYKVAIECKDYNKNVSKEKVMSFHSLLMDIGNTHGIYVSKLGFQKGAHEYADRYGIELKEIRHPTDKDWKGRLRNLFLDIHVISNIDIEPRATIDITRCKKLGIPLPKDMRVGDMPDQVIIDYEEMVNDKKEISPAGRKTMYDLINMLPQDKSVPENSAEFVFKEGFISYPKMKLPLNKIEIRYKTVESIEHMEIHGDDIIKAIVKDTIAGSEKHIDYQGHVSDKGKI
jgi:hypothetical protein